MKSWSIERALKSGHWSGRSNRTVEYWVVSLWNKKHQFSDKAGSRFFKCVTTLYMTQYFKLEFYQWPRKNCKTIAGCQKQSFQLPLYPRQHYKDLGYPMHPAAPTAWNLQNRMGPCSAGMVWLEHNAGSFSPKRWLLHPSETFHSVLPLPEGHSTSPPWL